MSCVGSKNTAPELTVRSIFHKAGLRFRLHADDLPGRPDIVNRKKRFVVFVHGCFWHGHSCKRGKKPTSNVAYWSLKLARNKERDIAASAALQKDGWKVLTIWECQIADIRSLKRRAQSLLKRRT